MKDAKARTIFLKDYLPPAFIIETTALHFSLFEDYTIVKSELVMSINAAVGQEHRTTMVLDGQDMELLSF